MRIPGGRSPLCAEIRIYAAIFPERGDQNVMGRHAKHLLLSSYSFVSGSNSLSVASYSFQYLLYWAGSM